MLLNDLYTSPAFNYTYIDMKLGEVTTDTINLK